MLQQGTAKRSAMQIADEAALLGTTVSTGANMDGSSVGTSALTKNFPGILDLLADIVLHPAFPPEEIERRRAARLAALANDRGEPNVIVSRTGVAALFGPHHPFGYDNTGTEESNKAMSREDMMNFWQTNYVPNNAALVVAGNISRDELKALATQKFGAWSVGEAARPQIGAPETTKARRLIMRPSKS
jgi:zinc protease